MDVATVVGIFLGISLMVGSILMSGSLMAFVDLTSVMIVAGGTIAATLISFPLPTVLGCVKVMRNAFLTRKRSPLKIITQLVGFAERARREGILSLDSVLDEVDDEFLKTGTRLAIDGVEPELIKDILHTELAFIEERHKTGQSVLTTMATMAPAFGMIGTLIGLILMLRNLSDPSTIGPNMAVAVITTFYGAVAANILFIPLSTKLKGRTAEEILIKEITIEGIMAIQSGDNPRIVQQKLLAFLSPRMRAGGGLERSEEAAA